MALVLGKGTPRAIAIYKSSCLLRPPTPGTFSQIYPKFINCLSEENCNNCLGPLSQSLGVLLIETSISKVPATRGWYNIWLTFRKQKSSGTGELARERRSIQSSSVDRGFKKGRRIG